MAGQQTPLITGATENTPKSILLSAGTIHRGLESVAESGWNFKETVIGATSGGNKITFTPEIVVPEIDGLLVECKGFAFKKGETAALEVNMIELTTQMFIDAGIMISNQSGEVTGFTEITSSATMTDDHYSENISFVGKTEGGDPIIIILPNARGGAGIEMEAKMKEGAIVTVTYTCTGDVTDPEKLPYKIYMKTPAAA